MSSHSERTNGVFTRVRKFIFIVLLLTTAMTFHVVVFGYSKDYGSSVRPAPLPVFRMDESMLPLGLYDRKEEIEQALSESQNEKIIIDWYPRHNESINAMMHGSCGACWITTNKSKITEPNAAAVVFLYKHITNETMPEVRRPDQLHVWQSGETPGTMLHSPSRLKRFEFFDEYGFNATLTYRRDADIYRPYGTSVNLWLRSKQLQTNTSDILSKKSKLALAVVSNCKGTPGARLRLEILKNLSRMNFNLDLLGRCFPGYTITRNTSEFLDELETYKFYFAFENSYHCRDYITEKFYRNALMANTVPVVWGPTKNDLDATVPPGSYIYAEDMTHADLIDYLQYLDKNDDAYMEYFRWQTMDKEDMPGYGRSLGYCHLCRTIHGINIDDVFSPTPPDRPIIVKGMINKTMPSLSKRYFGTENRDCLKSFEELRLLYLEGLARREQLSKEKKNME